MLKSRDIDLVLKYHEGRTILAKMMVPTLKCFIEGNVCGYKPIMSGSLKKEHDKAQEEFHKYIEQKKKRRKWCEHLRKK